METLIPMSLFTSINSGKLPILLRPKLTVCEFMVLFLNPLKSGLAGKTNNNNFNQKLIAFSPLRVTLPPTFMPFLIPKLDIDFLILVIVGSCEQILDRAN